MNARMGEGCNARHDAALKTIEIQGFDSANTGEVEQDTKHFNPLRANLTRPAPDLRAVGAFLRQIGRAA